jgi:TPR repeat protein
LDDGFHAHERGDYAGALKSFRNAAEQGDSEAQYMLGSMYNFGDGAGISYTEAAKWYRKAADQGEADAQRYLGSLYYTGSGVQKDDAEAIRWWRRSAEQGQALLDHRVNLPHIPVDSRPPGAGGPKQLHDFDSFRCLAFSRSIMEKSRCLIS